MPSLFLELACETDVAISERSATLGGYQPLDYVPGSQLLGAAARLLYDTLPPEASFRIFHAGAVRFGNALPVSRAGEPAYPIPLSFHHEKGCSWEEGGRAIAERLANRSRASATTQAEREQIRSGYLDRFGFVAKPDLRSTLRTAVHESGRAREGFLYGIGGIPGGTRLLARVDADDSADLERLRGALAGRTLLLGRSRQAEMGRVACRETTPFSEPRGQSAPPEDEAVFWCLSDLALRNPETGQPEFEPFPEAFGLPAGFELDLERSFLRPRRYSPFNGKRRRPDLERQVIIAGSVIFFAGRGAARCDPQQIRRRVERGVGEYRQDGLGRVAFAPVLLAAERPVFEEGGGATRAAEPHVAEPTGPLRDWLRVRNEEIGAEEKAWKNGYELAKAFVALRHASAIHVAQWGEIRRLARVHGERAGAEIDRFIRDGVRKLAWAKEVRRGESLADWLIRELAEVRRKDGSRHAAMVAEAMAQEVPRLAKTRKKKQAEAGA